jgi:integrase
MFRLGGRDSAPRYGGTFTTKREAEARKGWIANELAAMRVPNIKLVTPKPTITLAAEAARWRASRVDVAAGTAAAHAVNLNRILPRLGKRAIVEITPADVAELVAELGGEQLARESIRKTLSTLAMIFDFVEISPNPVRHASVKLPREDRAEPTPPTADHVEAVFRLLPARYRLPLLVLDSTGMRVGELEQLTWGDVDEPRGRWRVSQTASKTGRARWVRVVDVLFEAAVELCPRDDRVADRRVFEGVTADRLRTAIARACTAAAVPAFSPHDLRHRRISLAHLSGVPWARIGEQVGQRNLAVTANTYTHVLVDECELDYAKLLGRARGVQTRVQTWEAATL